MPPLQPHIPTTAGSERSPLKVRWASWADRLLTSRAAATLAGAAGDLMDLLLPSVCTVCTQEPGTLCPRCREKLRARMLRPYRAEDGADSLPLLGESSQPLPVVAAARYGDEISAAVLAFKDHGRTGMARELRPGLRRALMAAPELVPELAAPRGPGVGPITVIPVPGSAGGYRMRGYDPVAELLVGTIPEGWALQSRWVAHRWPRLVPEVRLWPPTKGPAHAGSTVVGRRRQSWDRFRATRTLQKWAGRGTRAPARRVVLVDDVMTTGSTLAGVARALIGVGMVPVAAVVLAAVSAPDGESERHGDRIRAGS